MVNSIVTEFVKSKSGFDTLKINGVFVHSGYDPRNEHSALFYEGNIIVLVLGGGLLYGVNNILKNNPNALIIVYEPIIEVYSYNINIKSDVINRVLYLNNICSERISDFIEEKNCFLEYRLKIVEPSGYRDHFISEFNEIAQIVQAAINNITQNVLTESEFFPLWIKNIFCNISNSEEIKFLTKESKVSDQRVACVISAGPGLNKIINDIIKFRKYMSIICVDTALKVLLEYGIEPDIIVTLDAQYYSLDDFYDKIPESSVMVADIVSYPAVGRFIPEQTFYTATENINKFIPYDKLLSNKIKPLNIVSGGTVSDYAISIAIALGYKQLILCGLDLGFPELKTHANGSPFHTRAVSSADYFSTVDTIYAGILSRRDPYYLKSDGEAEIFTDFILNNYRQWITKLIEIKKDIEFFIPSNISVIPIRGIKRALIEDIVVNDKGSSMIIDYRKSESNIIMLQNTLVELYDYSKVLSVYIDMYNDEKNINSEIIEDIHNKIDEIETKYPFFKRFTIMTLLLLSKKSVTRESGFLWYKHYSFKLLQSIYYIIRIVQKITNRHQS